MEFDKKLGCWEEHGTSELDDVAYYLYCKFVKEMLFNSGEMTSKMANQHYLMSERYNDDNIYKKYYVKAESILRNKKIDKLKNGI